MYPSSRFYSLAIPFEVGHDSAGKWGAIPAHVGQHSAEVGQPARCPEGVCSVRIAVVMRPLVCLSNAEHYVFILISVLDYRFWPMGDCGRVQNARLHCSPWTEDAMTLDA